MLAQLPAPTVLVLGDMAEVGENGPQMHEEVGQYARNKGISYVFTYGNASALAARACGPTAEHMTDIHEIAEKVVAKQPASILVKGSRSMRMERVVQDLQSWSEKNEAGHAL